MGERVNATFRVSGKIKRSIAAQLVELYATEGLVTYDEHEDAPTEENIGEWFVGHAVNYGNLDTLETFCGVHAIDYEGNYESGSWGAGGVYRMRNGQRDDFVDAGDDIPCIAIANLITPEALSTGWGPIIQCIRKFLEPMPNVEIVED